MNLHNMAHPMMMNTRTLRRLAALFALCGLLSFLGSCERHTINDDPARHQAIDPDERVMPAEDQFDVKLTAEIPTAVFSSFSDKTTGAAFVKRLGTVSSSVTDNTMMVLIEGSEMSSTSDEAIGAIADVLLRDGFLAIETPTAADLLTFIARLITVQSARQQQYIDENYEFGEGIDPSADATASLRARYDARLQTMQDIATRSGMDRLDDVMAEMIIISNREYFFQQPIGAEIPVSTAFINDDGNRDKVEQGQVVVERTSYTCGRMADEAADWLNGIDAQRNKTKALTRSIATKADGGASLNNLMDASETFTMSSPLYHTLWDKDPGWRQNGVAHTFRSWGVHNMRTKKDYYYIQQEVLVKIGPTTNKDGSVNLVYYPKAENEWVTAKNFGPFNRWYGSFFSRFITSMNLTGSGSITQEEAMPYTDNSTSYKTVNVGAEQSYTETLGITWGGTIGLDPGINLGGDYSLGKTNGTYFEVAHSVVENDISVVKNTDGTKVTWTYAGTPPIFREIEKGDYVYFYHTIASKALVNDVNMDNQIVWSVANPTGSYTVEVESHPFVAALVYGDYDSEEYWGTPRHQLVETYTSENNTFDHTLLEPFRATQTWRMVVMVNKMQDGGPAGSAGKYLTERIREQFSCFRSEITLCDRTPTSVQVINANILATKKIFQNNLDLLQQFAEEQGVKKFTIQWRCDNADIRLREGFVVETL